MLSRLFTQQSPYKKQARFAAVLWTLLIFILCLWPGDELPKSDIPLIDKWVHLVLFAPFTFLWFAAYPARAFQRTTVIFIAGCCMGYLVECLQGAFPGLGRSYDLLDVAADAIGSLIGVLLFALSASQAKRS